MWALNIFEEIIDLYQNFWVKTSNGIIQDFTLEKWASIIYIFITPPESMYYWIFEKLCQVWFAGALIENSVHNL